MKKLLFLLLCTVAMYGQTYQNPTFGTVTSKTNVEDNSAEKVLVQNSLGKLNWIYKNSLIPDNFTKVVYVDNNNPNSATIFDLNNPPTVNDNLLKSDVNNLYIGLDASTWVYNATSLNYVTKSIASAISNFFLSGTTTDAGNNKTAYIERPGTVKIPFFINERLGVGGSFGSTIKLRLTGDLSGGTTSTGILNESIVQSGVTSNAYYNRTFAGTQAASFNLPNLTHYMASQSAFGAGSSVTNQIGFHASNTLTGATNNYGFKGDLSSSANNWNLYLDGTAQNYLNGNVGIKTASPVGALDVNTGLSGMYPTYSTIPLGTFVFGNFSTLNTVPTIYSKSNTSIGMAFVGGTNDTNSEDMRFEVRENDGTDFSTLTSIGFKFRRFNTSLLDIYRNGNATLLGNLTIPNGTTTNHAVNKGQLDLKADNLLTGYVSGAGTVSGTDTVLQAIQKLNGNDLLKAPLASPALTGTPTAPTATAGTNTTQVATTAFVQAAVSSGSYTPTLTAILNIDSITLKNASYTKVGNIVTVKVSASVDATTINSQTAFSISLPFNRSLSASNDMGSGSTFSGVVNSISSIHVQSVSTTSTNATLFAPVASSAFFANVIFQYNVSE